MGQLEKSPVKISPGQWQEGRGFGRVYHKNPLYQAHFVMALFGFREELLMYGAPAEDPNIKAIEGTVRLFAERYPDFLQVSCEPDPETQLGTYHREERLGHLLKEIGVEAEGL